MRILIGVLIVILLGPFSTGPVAGEIFFMEDFNGSMRSEWWVERPDATFVTQLPTCLELRANSNDLWQWNNSAQNVYLIDNPTTGDFQVTVRLWRFALVNNNYANFDVLGWDNDDNFVRSYYLYSSGRKLGLGHEKNQVWTPWEVPWDAGNNPFFLCLRKQGNTYTQWYSFDGINFLQANGTVTFGDGTPAKLGFTAICDPSQSSRAYIDLFVVSDGPLTLPGPVENLTVRQDPGVTLQWQPPADCGAPPTKYRIYRGPNPETLSFLAEIDATLLSYNEVQAVQGTDYYYAVSAVNVLGEGPQTTALSVSTEWNAMDFNGDGIVNLIDLASFCQMWLWQASWH